MPKKFWIETYGCQMNFAESSALEIDLLKQGFVHASHEEEADVVIINTCSVRQTAENRIWGRLGHYSHLKHSKDLQLILTGCMAERLNQHKDKRKELNAVDTIIGTNGKNHIADILREDASTTLEGEDFQTYEFKSCHLEPGAQKAFIPIMNGCNNYCSYCIVPYVRGREVSRSPEEIFDEIKRLEDKNVKEIVLLGQNVNSYASTYKGKSFSFLDLLHEIAMRIHDISWIRYLSPHPKDFQPAIIDLTKEFDSICSHIHLPVQHGSDKILHSMNRKYTVQDYLKIINTFREKIPSMTFSTDLLIGFPGETEEDLEETLNFLRKVRFSDAFTYYYNPREGTAATEFAGQLEETVKLQRLRKVIDLQRTVSHEEKQKRLNGYEKVFVESVSKKDNNTLLARTEHDDMVLIPKNDYSIGKFYTIYLNELKGNTFLGGGCK